MTEREILVQETYLIVLLSSLKKLQKILIFFSMKFLSFLKFLSQI